MEQLQFGLQSISDGQGVGIAMTGMSIVFVALALISVFIALLPRILRVLARYVPESSAHASPQPRPVETTGRHAAGAGDASMVVAIGFALHTARQRQLAER